MSRTQHATTTVPWYIRKSFLKIFHNIYVKKTLKIVYTILSLASFIPGCTITLICGLMESLQEYFLSTPVLSNISSSDFSERLGGVLSNVLMPEVYAESECV